MLSDMHHKLSEAVKLYDELLTKQIAHPRWRSPQPTANQYEQTNSYSQWATSAPATTSAYQPQPQLSQASHSNYLPPGQSQGVPLQPQWQSPQYAQPSPQQYSSIPGPAPPASVSPQSLIQPQRRHSTYSEPPQVYQQPGLQSPVLPPVSLSAQQYQYPSPKQPQSPPPIKYAASPPPQHHLQQPQQPITVPMPPSSSLNRAKSVSYAYSPPPPQAVAPPIANGHLGRSSTVTARPTHGYSQSLSHAQLVRQQQQQQQYQQQQIQQQLMQAPAPPSNIITEFPVVPTEAPHVYSMYGHVVSDAGGGYVSTETHERKEAPLIDL